MSKKKDKAMKGLKRIIRGTVLENKPEDDLWIFNPNWGVWLKGDTKPGYALFEEFLGKEVIITIEAVGEGYKPEKEKEEGK